MAEAMLSEPVVIHLGKHDVFVMVWGKVREQSSVLETDGAKVE